MRQRFASARRPAAIEPIEARRLLSASIVFEGSQVIATGTEGHDTFRIERVGFDDVRVRVNDVVRTFDMDDVGEYLLRGLEGSDSFTKVGDIRGAVSHAVSVDGGPGDIDSLTGSGPDLLIRGIDIVSEPSGRLVGDRDEDGTFRIFGTSGNDLIVLEHSDDGRILVVNGSFFGLFAESDQLTFAPSGLAGDDQITVGERFSAGVIATGDAGKDRFDIGRLTNVEVHGGDGDDSLYVRGDDFSQIASFRGDAGTDEVLFDEQTGLDLGDDPFRDVENVANARGTVIGNDLNNRIAAGGGTAGVVFHGRGGDDTLIGLDGLDQLFGDDGDDTLLGNSGNDLLDGGVGIDNLNGGAGVNTLRNGENGAGPRFFIETLGPGARNLTAYGTLGADTMNVVRTGVDDVRITVNGVSRTFDMDDFDTIELYGGPGADTMSAGAGVAAVSMRGRGGNDRLTGNELFNVLSGDDGDDTLLGNGGNDALFGEAGNDSLDGGGGNDQIFGRDGDDRITGGTGVDEMSGGNGNDTFFVRDGVADNLVDGDAGTDRAQADANDPLTEIEQLLP